ncbi:MAG: SusD/RagB family nutrient-binding outer membrane lipoprotein [Bacteroidota bacterium]|nr:SusD/RagB family nutrient-binding outer membrane lipoprotein [Bacteroidota bacterium]MDP4272991.1 SusD/RagB family nutrient-binding outer membrane lipoprotein [Bacteroidota bacterium]
MKKLYYIFIAIVTLTIASSCSNFNDLNTNPDAATTVTPEMLATGVMKSAFRFWNPNPTDFATGNLWCHHTANANGTPNPYEYFYSYWPYGGFDSYTNLTNLKRMVEFSKGTKYESSFKGLALFMKAWYGFQMTLDMGDIPYSETGQAEDGITRPKYDKQADVFVSILNDLKSAEADFAAGTNFGGDIMYNGDVTKWRKLCNTMQLKVLQTISKKITPDQKARFAAIVSAGNLMVDNSDNFQLVYTSAIGTNHPFWSGETNRTYVVLSKLVVDNLKALNDRRLFYFADPAPALIASGKLENDFNAYEGANTSLSSDAIALNNQQGNYSLINLRYTKDKAGDPMLKLTYAEQCFIIAEAIEEGWVTGNAKDYYESGVKSMLKLFMNLPTTATHGMSINQAYIDNYFTGAAAYATSGTKTDRLHQIWIQRWLIDFFQGNGLNYPQILRTGYPVLPLDPATSMNPDDKTIYPKRWKYPTSEQVSNPDNYKKAIDEQYGGYDGINQIPWWLKE